MSYDGQDRHLKSMLQFGRDYDHTRTLQMQKRMISFLLEALHILLEVEVQQDFPAFPPNPQFSLLALLELPLEGHLTCL